MKLLYIIALAVAKLMRFGMRLLGRNASYLPGKAALRICPRFLKYIGKPQFILGVTGTNGKTTTSNLIGDTLANLGEKVLSNRFGSNIDAGIASVLIEGTGFTGKSKYSVAVLEIDERSSRRVLPYLQPDLLLITNLFRDSMYRNAHPEYIADFISSAVPEKTTLVLCADDIIACCVAPGNRRVYYGITGDFPEVNNIVCDARACPVCGSPLHYTKRYYNHIGRVECPNCMHRSPEPSITGHFERDRFIIGKTAYLPLASNLQNSYNQLAAAAAIITMGYESHAVADAMSRVEIVKSRYSETEGGGRKLICTMAKGLNSVACSGVFDQTRRMSGRKAVILMLDDVYDERDSSENIAWIYDADFEFLNHPSITQVLVGGIRALDYDLRLRIAGIEPSKIFTAPTPAELVAPADLSQCDTVILLFELYRYDEAMRVRDTLLKKMEAETV